MTVIRIVFWLIVLGFFSLPVLAWYALDDAPLVTQRGDAPVEAAGAARDFLQRFDPRNAAPGKVTEVTATPAQINAALAGALAPVPGLHARVVPSRYGLVAGITDELPVPQNPFGRYVNIRMLLDSSGEGIHIGQMSIGDIDVPSPIVRPIFLLVMNRIAGPGSGRAFLDGARALRVNGGSIQLIFGPESPARPGGTGRTAMPAKP